MNDKTYEINKAKVELEREKFEFEKQKYKSNNKFFNKNFGVTITAIISIATIIVSIIQLQMTKTTKANEILLNKQKLDLNKLEDERRYKLDVSKFILENSKVIFSDNLAEQERIRNVMIASFPPNINEQVFPQIRAAKDDIESQTIWEEGEEQVTKIIDIEDLISKDNEDIQYLISLLNSSDKATRQKASSELTNRSDKQQVVDLLIDNLKSDDEKLAYRNNFYIAFTLYKMPNGWTASDKNKAKVKNLRNGKNYNDYYYKKYVELALDNMR